LIQLIRVIYRAGIWCTSPFGIKRISVDKKSQGVRFTRNTFRTPFGDQTDKR